jgi:hypothetical protein
MPGQGLVNGVIDHLIDQMVKASLAHITDVHGRPLANCF